MTRGRPAGSKIRQNIIEILYHIKEGYGYDIYKTYIAIFPKVTMRSIYYHLNKGAEMKVFKIHKVKVEKGNYSWGKSVEKIYYSLGKNGKPLMMEKVAKYFSK